MHPKHPLPCSQVSANGFCTQWTEFITHLQTLFIKDLFWDYIPFWKTEGRTEVMKSRGRRGKQLLDDLKETTGYWTLKEDTLFSLCGRGYGPVVRQTMEWMKEWMNFLLQQGLVIFLEPQGLRAFYRPLSTLKSTWAESQNIAVPECDISWRTQWSRGTCLRHTAPGHRTGSLSSHIALLTALSGAWVNLQLATKIKKRSKVRSIICH